MNHIRNMLLPLGLMVGIITASFGFYILIWGWARFVADFWPLDHSQIGPNLCASVALGVLLIAHNEFVVEKRATTRHESHKQALEDGLKELLHPTEEAEDNIAAEVEEQFRNDILDRLDPETPGGIGVIAAKLDAVSPTA